jgi:hypothetical protein
VKAEFAALDDASRHGKRGEFLVGRIGGLSHAIQLIRADGKGDIIR